VFDRAPIISPVVFDFDNTVEHFTFIDSQITILITVVSEKFEMNILSVIPFKKRNGVSTISVFIKNGFRDLSNEVTSPR
jgi:hypothetical protein